MKIPELFKNGRTVFSFEVFPPKKDNDVSVIYDTLEQLGDLHPDFISVTYGAGGSAAGASTIDLVKRIKSHCHTESIAHLTCVNSTHADIDEKIKELETNGIENVLALRGDINPNIPPKHEFEHASDLIEYMKPRSNLSFSGGCYPEVHPEAANMVDDIHNLKKKGGRRSIPPYLTAVLRQQLVLQLPGEGAYRRDKRPDRSRYHAMRQRKVHSAHGYDVRCEPATQIHKDDQPLRR